MKAVLIHLALICLITSCNFGRKTSGKDQDENTLNMKTEGKDESKLTNTINQDQKLIANKHFQLNIILDLTSFAEKLDGG